MNTQPTPDEARELLERAARAESVTRSGASWPHIASLFGIGASSSLALLAFAKWPDDNTVLYPIAILMVWVIASILLPMVFGRSTKRGFQKRWLITNLVWGVVWAVGIFGTLIWFPGQLWFALLGSLALTVVALAGAWIEARR